MDPMPPVACRGVRCSTMLFIVAVLMAVVQNSEDLSTMEGHPDVPVEDRSTMEGHPDVPVEDRSTMEGHPDVPVKDRSTMEGHPDVPVVFLAVMVTARENPHLLPHHLYYLRRIHYPKDRMRVCIYTPSYLAESVQLLRSWIERVKLSYKRVDLRIRADSRPWEEWKEEALDLARRTGSDYLWMLDANTVHGHTDTLRRLILGSCNKTDVAPNLNSIPVAHDCHVYCRLLNDADDCVNATGKKNIESDIVADDKPITKGSSSMLINLHPLQHRYRHHPGSACFCDDVTTRLSDVKLPPKRPDKLGFDEIYVVNLKRRSNRKRKMLASLKALGIQARFFDGIDGRDLNKTFIEDSGIKVLSSFTRHRYDRSNRVFTLGEVGCFLSHYNIWQDMIRRNFERVLILEDDVRFKPDFRQRLSEAMGDIKRLDIDWDLVYMGRKPINASLEVPVPGSEHLVYPENSHWTLGYILRDRAARTLVRQRPLQRMVPVDHYLPIMFDKYHYDYNKLQYTERDLKALSVHPLLVEPSHLKHQAGFVSDTVRSTSLGGILVNDKRVEDNGAMML